MKKILFTLYFLLASAMGFADGIDMVGDPPNEHLKPDNRGQTLLPTVDYADSEVTISVPFENNNRHSLIQGHVLLF